MMNEMMKNFMGGAGGNDTEGGGGGAPNFNMDMLSGLMQQMGMGMGGAGAGGGNRSGQGTARPNVPAMNQNMRRTIQARQLRKKLEKRKENVRGDVEEA
jgi:hypothetical protein